MYFSWRYSQNTHEEFGFFNDMSYSTEEQANDYLLKLTCCFFSLIPVIQITGQVEMAQLQQTYFLVSVFDIAASPRQFYMYWNLDLASKIEWFYKSSG